MENPQGQQISGEVGAAATPSACAEFAFTAPQLSMFQHVHHGPFDHPQSSSQLPSSLTQLGGHYFFGTPSPLSPTMPHPQHPFSQFDIPMRSTLSTMQFPPFF